MLPSLNLHAERRIAQRLSRAAKARVDPATLIQSGEIQVRAVAESTDRRDVLTLRIRERCPDEPVAGEELAPGGRYYVIVSDKRFCFDHFVPETTIAQVVAAHRAGRTVHDLASVIEHVAMSTHNDATRHWRGDHGSPLDPDGAMRVKAAMERFEAANGGYVDVHAWYFTPANFASIIELLFRLRLTPMRATVVYDTPLDRQEFCAVLEVAE